MSLFAVSFISALAIALGAAIATFMFASGLLCLYVVNKQNRLIEASDKAIADYHLATEWRSKPHAFQGTGERCETCGVRGLAFWHFEWSDEAANNHATASQPQPSE